MPSNRWAPVADAEALLADQPLALDLFQRVQAEVDACGGAELRTAPTQVGWARRRGFALIWTPRRWLGQRGAEAVLTFYLSAPIDSPRLKQVSQVRPGLFAHHLEVASIGEFDHEVAGWIARAYDEGG